MTTKRMSPADSNGSDSRGGGRESPGPGGKRSRYVIFEPVRLPAISTVSDLDHKVLVVQNQKLAQRLAQRNRVEEELRRRIEQLEKRQTQDDALLMIINRHWNRLDEDVRILLERFDSEIAEEPESKNESDATVSFIAQLSQWDKEELSERLLQRVEFSKRAIGKLVSGFDRLLQRNERIASMLKKQAKLAKKSSSENDSKPKKEFGGGGGGAAGGEDKTDSSAGVVKKEPKEEPSDEPMDTSTNTPQLIVDKAVADMNIQLIEENRRLQQVSSKLQEKNHALSVKITRTEDRLTAAETSIEELKSKLEEAEYGLENARNREDKLEYRLADVAKQLQKTELQLAQASAAAAAVVVQSTTTTTTSKSTASNDPNEMANVSKSKLEDLQAQYDEQKELAANRLQELHDLIDQHKGASKAIESLKMELSHVPEHLILNSSAYVRLQSHFSVLFAENQSMRAQLDGVRQELDDARSAHVKQVMQMESDELMAQKELRGEMTQYENQLSQVRREYEMLRVEFEQNLAQNEQSGPLNKEMRQLLAGYKIQNGQLKAEAGRFKRKWRDAVSLVAKVQKELDQEKKTKEDSIVIPLTSAAAGMGGGGDETGTIAGETPSNEQPQSESTKEDEQHQSANLDSSIGELSESDAEMEHVGDENDENQTKEKLRKSIKQLTKRCAELKAELDAFKNLSTEEKEKAQNEKRLTLENQKLRAYIRHCGRKHGKESMMMADEPSKHIKRLEDQIERFKKEVQASKQEEEALLNEVETTGQAFEELQEQNVRLVQQLKEKDDANFKLMSERIRSNQQHKLLREEKELLDDQVAALHNQVEALNVVVRKLEEKQCQMQTHLNLNEKELVSRHQAGELHKRKATEMSQSVVDLKLQLDKLTSQLAEAQTAVSTKTLALEDENFKMRRLQEDISIMRKRLERLKKMEQATTADEVLMEEIRELKSQLICPSCKVQKKDAVLTKCFHVFCMECLKTRYETRQRKCPKCNAAFGANDFKRIYIG